MKGDTMKNGGSEMREALALIRKHSTYFICGEWPAIVQNQLPETFKPGKKYAVAIIEVPE